MGVNLRLKFFIFRVYIQVLSFLNPLLKQRYGSVGIIVKQSTVNNYELKLTPMGPEKLLQYLIFYLRRGADLWYVCLCLQFPASGVHGFHVIPIQKNPSNF